MSINPAALAALLKGDLENFMVASTPSGIEAQEKAGQAALVNSSMLPLELHGCTWADLETIGIVPRDQVDDLFVNVDLPPGWTKRGTDHDMHSDLLDEKGRRRFGIFYKAAFYDRRADMAILRRYTPTQMPVNGWDDFNGPRHGVVQDQGDVIWHTDEQADSKDYKTKDALAAQATRWLDEHYPDWQNPLAYWD